MKPTIISQPRIDTSNITIQPIQTEQLEILQEALSERGQDDAREGFQNFGNGSDYHSSVGLAWARKLNMQGGDDRVELWGNPDDTVYGGSGNDRIHAANGDNILHGQSGDDTLTVYNGDDKLYGGSGNDTLFGGGGTDMLYGGTGNDVIYGGGGIDNIFGGAGDDIIFGDLDGSTADDQGRDVINGGYGNDEIHGGGGADRLYGDAGADRFVFDTASDLGFGHSDLIGDFSRSQGDKIVLIGIDANTTVLFPGDQAFTFVNGPSNQAGTLWLGAVSNGQQRVFMNIDGFEPDLDIMVKFNDPSMTSLQASDFLL